MGRLDTIRISKAQRAGRTRAKVKNASGLPRLSVSISNTNVYAQVIDDTASKTVASANSLKLKGTMTEKATKVGEAIAEASKKAKVTKVVFDRGAKQYHGRIKALADAAREKGLEF